MLRKALQVSALSLVTTLSWAAEPALTIYNGGYGVVRESVPLELQAGANEVKYADATAHVEPDSVILRDPSGQRELRILEQNYRADPVSQELLLSLYEGQTIEFKVQRGESVSIQSGRIIRAGYVPHPAAWQQYGNAYFQNQMAYSQGTGGQPIVEIDGRIQFGLPGQPLFPSLTDATILKPTLHWRLETAQAGPLNAELAYLTGGMRWEATYNALAPEEGDTLELIGWVTMDNQSGKSFENARIKLMAGDVKKIQPPELMRMGYGGGGLMDASMPQRPPVTEKTFDEYHLYTLDHPTTLLDRETKQVEFVRSGAVTSERVYVYDGAKIDSQRYQGWGPEQIRREENYGIEWNPDVWVMRELANSEANGLGVALPAGRMRFYRTDADGRMEFVGENTIRHTPRDERLRLYTGNAFDLVGERRRIAFSRDTNQDRWVRETFEITLRNRKKEPVEVRVVEHLYRWQNWEISGNAVEFAKLDDRTVEFRVPLQPDQEQKLQYTVHYTW